MDLKPTQPARSNYIFANRVSPSPKHTGKITFPPPLFLDARLPWRPVLTFSTTFKSKVQCFFFSFFLFVVAVVGNYISNVITIISYNLFQVGFSCYSVSGCALNFFFVGWPSLLSNRGHSHFSVSTQIFLFKMFS